MESRLLIGGERVAGEGPELRVENPYTEATLATVRTPSPTQLDAALATASEASRSWGATPAAERAELLHAVAAGLRAHTDELAELMTREGGKPRIENADEVGWTAAAFDFYAELGRAEAGRVIPPIEASQLALVLKEPIGVVAAIVPWNYPLLLLAWKLAPGARGRQRGGGQAERAHAALDARAGTAVRRVPGRCGDAPVRGRGHRCGARR